MCKKLIYLVLVSGFCLAAARGGDLTMVPLSTCDITGDYGDILSLNGIPASNLITGTSTFANPPGSSPDEPASSADDLSLYTAACADSQAWMKTIFGQPVTTIFILEKSGNDSGTIQGLAADGSTLVGNAVAFTGGSSYWTSTGYLGSYGHGQTAYGTVITSDVPIYGILITSPGIDPISISAVRPFFNFLDFADFAAQWLRADCGPSNSWCSGADLNFDSFVLLDDLQELVYYWLGCGLPHSFSLSSPANGATGVTTNPNLIWTASLGATSYTLVVDDNNDYSSPVFNQDVGNVISKVVLGLANSTTYYWKVTAHNSAGDTAASNNSFSFTTTATPPPTARWLGEDGMSLAEFNSQFGGNAQVHLRFCGWTWLQNFSSAASAITNDAADGGITMWSMQSETTNATILSGSYDAYLHTWAADAAADGRTFLFRFNHEMNGDWYAWGYSGGHLGNTPESYAQAWRHVHDIFTQEGATNVKWVFCPNAGYTSTASYPGDAYVDYIGIDGYNWGTTQPWSSWQSFTSVFQTAYNTLTSLTDKPVIICETSCFEQGGNKADWITSAFLTEIPTSFPEIIGLIWFNEGSFVINTSPAALAAFQEVAQNPLWQGTFVRAFSNVSPGGKNLMLGSNLGCWGEDNEPFVTSSAQQDAAAAVLGTMRFPCRTLSTSFVVTVCDSIVNNGIEPLVILSASSNPQDNVMYVTALIGKATYFEHGNENNWAQGWNGTQYANSWRTWVPQMRAANPNIKVGGPVGSHFDTGGSNYLREFLNAIKNEPELYPDFISMHVYAEHGEDTSDDAVIAKAHSWGDGIERMKADCQSILGVTLPFAITEWNWDAVPENTGDNRQNDATFQHNFNFAVLDEFKAHGVWMSCQYDFGSGAGGGKLDMYNKPQYTAFVDWNNANPPGPMNNPPTVAITSPADGATFAANADITINADASDSDGSVTKVEFFEGTTKLGEDTSAPYEYTWYSVAEDYYSLTAKATDNGGATATSAAVSITVGTPPPPPSSMEAEDMTLTNYVVNTNSAASGGSLIKLSASGVTGSATYTFSGATDTYDIQVWYFDEDDGACTLRVYVGGAMVDEWVANQNLGSAYPVAATRTSHTKASVSITNGDQIKLEAVQNAQEWGRYDNVYFFIAN